MSFLIRTIRSDALYPWPAGKAPWSIENGGSGIPPHNAKENFGMNKFNGTLTENKFKPDPGLSASRGGWFKLLGTVSVIWYTLYVRFTTVPSKPFSIAGFLFIFLKNRLSQKKRCYLSHCYSNKGLNGTVVNRAKTLFSGKPFKFPYKISGSVHFRIWQRVDNV